MPSLVLPWRCTPLTGSIMWKLSRAYGHGRAGCPHRLRLEGLVPRECFGGTTHVFQPKAGKSMKHPTPSDFIVNVKESHVSVMFKPTDSYYNFGRLTDPGDIARHGPLSQSPNVRHAKTGDTAASRACRSPIAASREAVIVEIFESRSIGRTQRRQSPSALAAVAYVQGTERPGHRKFTEGHELHRKWRVPKAMIGRRLSQEEAKRLLAKFE